MGLVRENMCKCTVRKDTRERLTGYQSIIAAERLSQTLVPNKFSFRYKTVTSCCLVIISQVIPSTSHSLLCFASFLKFEAHFCLLCMSCQSRRTKVEHSRDPQKTEEESENTSLSETGDACWKTVGGRGEILIIRWDQILESLGNQNREFGHENIGNYIFVSSEKYDKGNFLESSSEFDMKHSFS